MSDKRKTALITGSGRNIGRAMAHDLAKDGFNIIVNGSSSREPCDRVADEVRALGVDAEVMMCNVGDKSELTAMGEAALKRFGSVDVIVNNVAIRPISRFSKLMKTNGTGSSTST